MQIGDEAKDMAAPRAGSCEFKEHLQEWLASGGQLPLAACSALAMTTQQLLRDKAAHLRQPLLKYKLALYVVLSGDRQAAEQLLRVCPVRPALEAIGCKFWVKPQQPYNANHPIESPHCALSHPAAGAPLSSCCVAHCRPCVAPSVRRLHA